MPAVPTDRIVGAPSGGFIAGGRYVAPVWAPVAGEIKTISKAAGYFGTNGGATVAEINPAYQTWNPDAPAQGRFAPAAYYWVSILGYAGVCWNPETRQLINYGAGHASPNVTAPFGFDLKELRYKWLDTPLPFDGYGRVLTGGYSVPPSQSVIDVQYPNGEVDYTWGDLNGDSTGWPEGFAQPGIIQPITSHTRGHLAYIPSAILGNASGGMFVHGQYTGVLSGASSRGSHIFDFDTKRWRRTANIKPDLPIIGRKLKQQQRGVL